MRQVLICVALAFSVATVPLAAPAQTASPADVKVGLARQYFEAIRIDRQLDAVMGAMGPLVGNSMAQQMGVAANSDEARAIGALMAEVNIDVMRSITPRYLDMMAKVAADTFTEAELRAMVEFYTSPLGRSITEKSPAMAPAAAAAMQGFMPEIEVEFQNQICRRLGCEPPAAKKARGA